MSWTPPLESHRARHFPYQSLSSTTIIQVIKIMTYRAHSLIGFILLWSLSYHSLFIRGIQPALLRFLLPKKYHWELRAQKSLRKLAVPARQGLYIIMSKYLNEVWIKKKKSIYSSHVTWEFPYISLFILTSEANLIGSIIAIWWKWWHRVLLMHGPSILSRFPTGSCV